MRQPLLLSLGIFAAGLTFAPHAADASTPSLTVLGTAPTTWKVDPAHTTVGFRIKHMEASWFYGRFNEVSGTVIYDPEQPAASSINFEVNAASVDTHNQDRDDHLRNADFFNAKVHSKISFTSKKIEPLGENRMSVTGMLALHGVEKEIKIEAQFIGTGKAPWGELAGFETEFTIKRGDYGITTYPGALGEEVRIRVSIEALKQE